MVSFIVGFITGLVVAFVLVTGLLIVSKTINFFSEYDAENYGDFWDKE